MLLHIMQEDPLCLSASVHSMKSWNRLVESHGMLIMLIFSTALTGMSGPCEMSRSSHAQRMPCKGHSRT